MSKRGFDECSQRTLGKRSRENQLGEVNTEEYRRIRKIVKLNIVRNGMSVKESIRQFKVNSPPQMHVNSVASHASNVNGSSMSKPSNEGTDLWKILEQDLLEEIRIEQEMLQQQYEEQYAEYDDEAICMTLNHIMQPMQYTRVQTILRMQYLEVYCAQCVKLVT